MVGRVLCDDIAELFPDEDVFEHIGGVTSATMMRIDAGLKVALALRWSRRTGSAATGQRPPSLALPRRKSSGGLDQ